MTSEHMKNCKWCVLERLILDPQLKMMLFWNLLKKLLNNQKKKKKMKTLAFSSPLPPFLFQFPHSEEDHSQPK